MVVARKGGITCIPLQKPIPFFFDTSDITQITQTFKVSFECYIYTKN
jgi:hypothetical protein